MQKVHKELYKLKRNRKEEKTVIDQRILNEIKPKFAKSANNSAKIG
jgi:hypothetical protein